MRAPSQRLGPALRQIDADAGCCAVVAHQIDAAAAVDAVIARPAFEYFAHTVFALGTEQDVVVLGPAHLVDVDQHVVTGAGAIGRARRQIDRDPCAGAHVAGPIAVGLGDRIDLAAVDHVVTNATINDVVASPAAQLIGAGFARDDIRPVAAIEYVVAVTHLDSIVSYS